MATSENFCNLDSSCLHYLDNDENEAKRKHRDEEYRDLYGDQYNDGDHSRCCVYPLVDLDIQLDVENVDILPEPTV